MLAEGRYKARGVEGALGMTGTGREQVAVLVEVTQGEHAGEQLTWYGYFTEKTVDRTFESLRLLGWEGDDLTDLRGINANEVSIEVEHEEDSEGRKRARVKWINGGGGLVMKERLAEGAARAFAARMKGAAIASRQKSGGAPKPSNGQRPAQAARAASYEEAPPFDDDIGF